MCYCSDILVFVVDIFIVQYLHLRNHIARSIRNCRQRQLRQHKIIDFWNDETRCSLMTHLRFVFFLFCRTSYSSIFRYWTGKLHLEDLYCHVSSSGAYKPSNLDSNKVMVCIYSMKIFQLPRDIYRLAPLKKLNPIIVMP